MNLVETIADKRMPATGGGELAPLELATVLDPVGCGLGIGAVFAAMERALAMGRTDLAEHLAHELALARTFGSVHHYAESLAGLAGSFGDQSVTDLTALWTSLR
ncbi:hypothetical protein [Kutzneria buriramensis]|uniref:Uncharacterized protein n=1 Tax=Kutzneria buriramensis TaxID=1045776 RepID=A0A3E0GVE8_9PSEU|nr:hypothetical protein [Kutzneria buriramensis]REH28579.1 hypothetical protein BCF44_12621 [Kutzneria buriramensis]